MYEAWTEKTVTPTRTGSTLHVEGEVQYVVVGYNADGTWRIRVPP